MNPQGELITPEERRAIELRAEKATKGPWEQTYEWFIDKADIEFRTRSSTNPERDISHEECAANCRFVAHARTDIPRLLATIKALEGRIETMRKALASIQSQAEYNCKHNCQPIYGPYGRHAPDCFGYLGEEAKDALSTGSEDRKSE